ncbi:hypothetical protein ACFVZ8_08990 [Streptomyces sp. NPDC059558]|uniref:hypothetical protein n=1 Tax=Streptomyces sp. NPDC059558 TaxID=3346864 RepID=UPI0036C81B72
MTASAPHPVLVAARPRGREGVDVVEEAYRRGVPGAAVAAELLAQAAHLELEDVRRLAGDAVQPLQGPVDELAGSRGRAEREREPRAVPQRLQPGVEQVQDSRSGSCSRVTPPP